MEQRYVLTIRTESGALWAEVDGLPGCFASGATYTELMDAAAEAIGMYVADDDAAPDVRYTLTKAELRIGV